MPKDLEISILIATGGRPGYLAACLDSVFAAELPGAHEVIVLVNGPDKETEEILHRMSAEHGSLRQVRSGQHLTFGAARNRLIAEAKGAILYFIDDDVIVEPDLFSLALEKFEKDTDLDVLGGPNLTPPGSTRLQRIIGYFFESYFGASQMSVRYKREEMDMPACERSLILCNLAFRARTFSDTGLRFHDTIPSNEENLLLQRMSSGNRKMTYSPELIVYHHRRESIPGFCVQLFKYGRGRMENIAKYPRSFSPLFLAPVVFAAAILALITTHYPVFVVLPLAYALADLIATAEKAVKERDPIASPILFILFPLGHLSYAAGFTYQALKDVKKII